MNFNPFTYLREVRDELGKVSWPSRQQATNLTLVVIGGSLLVGLYVGGLDYLFTTLLGLILK